MSLKSDSPPAMPVPMVQEHVAEIIETSKIPPRPASKDDPYGGKAGNFRFPYLVVCNCAWQAYANSESEAEALRSAHIANRSIIQANQGIVQGRL